MLKTILATATAVLVAGAAALPAHAGILKNGVLINGVLINGVANEATSFAIDGIALPAVESRQ